MPSENKRTILREYRSILLFFLIHVIICATPGQSCQDISIEHPYDPFYVKTGGNITIKCLCDTGHHKLEWVRQTPDTSYVDSLIVPTKENSFVIQTLTEEPTGRTESTLIKYNMNNDDRGSYVCRESLRENSFGIWVTVITVNAKQVNVQADDETFHLQCQLDMSSFSTNPSLMNYMWEREGRQMSLTHSDTELTYDDKYQGRRDFWSSMSLVVSKPTQADLGLYTCTFIIPTNIGPVEISETFRVEGSPELPAGAPALGLPPCSSRIITQIVLATLVQLLTVHLIS